MRLQYLLLLLALASASAHAAPSFHALPSDGANASFTAYAISADGTSVVGTTGGDPARWTEAGGVETYDLVPTSDPSLAGGVALATSSDGSTSVGVVSNDGGNPNGSGARAVIFDSTQSQEVPGSLPTETSTSRALDVSGDGSVVVGSYVDITSFSPFAVEEQGFLWDSQNGLQRLGDLAGLSHDSRLTGVSSDGARVAGMQFIDSFSEEALVWSAADGLTLLGDFDGVVDSRSRANAISSDGSTVVGWANQDPSSFAMKWTEEGGLENLGFLMRSPFDVPSRGSNGEALAVSGDGSVIVGTSRDEAFIYSEDSGEMVRLRDLLISLGVAGLDDWSLFSATGISDDGLTIVGDGYNAATGRRTGWIAVIPEPSTALMTMLGFCLLATRRPPARRT